LSNVINEYEIRVWAIRRSGHHAIINWIASMFKEPVWHFNAPKCHANPYRKRKKYQGQMIQRIPEIMQHFSQTQWEIHWSKRPEMCPNIQKPCLIYNHEDYKLNEHPEPIPNLGKSDKQFSVLIMRSFKNMLASRLYEQPQWNLRKVQANTKDVPRFYEMYAKEFLDITHWLTFTPVKIWFDLWFSSRKYREMKAIEMDLVNSDDTIQHMAAHRKKGSTFDTFAKFKNQAKNMDVLNRYKKMENNKVYQKIIQKNPELLKLSDKIHKQELNEIH